MSLCIYVYSSNSLISSFKELFSVLVGRGGRGFVNVGTAPGVPAWGLKAGSKTKTNVNSKVNLSQRKCRMLDDWAKVNHHKAHTFYGETRLFYSK